MTNNQEDKTAEPLQNVAPLSFDELKISYPNTYRQFVLLSDREKSMADDWLDDSDKEEATADSEHNNNNNNNDLCTTITSVDFLEPLYENQNSKHLSEKAYSFMMFLWKMLDACESGSIGGEACRMMLTLTAALEDIETLGNNNDGHHHHFLLAWTIATVHHGIHPLLYRGEPNTNQALFNDASRLWKKVYQQPEKSFSAETRKFAISWCENFRELVEQAKEEYGAHADYSFDYIAKTRKRKVKA